MSLYKNIGPITFAFETQTAEIFHTNLSWLVQMKSSNELLHELSSKRLLAGLQNLANNYNDHLEKISVELYYENGKPPSWILSREHLQPFKIESSLNIEAFLKVANTLLNYLNHSRKGKIEKIDKDMFFQDIQTGNCIYLNFPNQTYLSDNYVSGENSEIRICETVMDFFEHHFEGANGVECGLLLKKLKKCQTLFEINEELKYFEKIYEIGFNKIEKNFNKKEHSKIELPERKRSLKTNQRKYYLKEYEKQNESFSLQKDFYSTNEKEHNSSKTNFNKFKQENYSYKTQRNSKTSHLFSSKSILTRFSNTERPNFYSSHHKTLKSSKGFFAQARANFKNSFGTYASTTNSSLRPTKDDSSRRSSILKLSQSIESIKEINNSEYLQKSACKEKVSESRIKTSEIKESLCNRLTSWKEKKSEKKHQKYQNTEDSKEPLKPIKRKTKISEIEEYQSINIDFKNKNIEFVPEEIQNLKKEQKIETIISKEEKEYEPKKTFETIKPSENLKNIEKIEEETIEEIKLTKPNIQKTNEKNKPKNKENNSKPEEKNQTQYETLSNKSSEIKNEEKIKQKLVKSKKTENKNKDNIIIEEAKKKLIILDLIGECVSNFPKNMSKIETGDKYLWQLPAFLLYKDFYFKRYKLEEKLKEYQSNSQEFQSFITQISEENIELEESLKKLLKSALKKTKKFKIDKNLEGEIEDILNVDLTHPWQEQLDKMIYNFICELEDIREVQENMVSFEIEVIDAYLIIKQIKFIYEEREKINLYDFQNHKTKEYFKKQMENIIQIFTNE